MGVDHYQFSVVDRTAPSSVVIDEALQIIHKHQLRKDSVYVHCKSGKGRSVTTVACYLTKVQCCVAQNVMLMVKISWQIIA